MDMNEFRTEAHVAQQSRRERLRVQQMFSGNVDTSSEDVGALRNGNLLCGPNFVSSGIIDLMDNPGNVGGSSFGNPSQSVSINLSAAFDDRAKQQESNWMALNCASASPSLGCRGNQNPSFNGVLLTNLRTNNTSCDSCQPTGRTSYDEAYPDVRSSELSNQYRHGKYEEMHLLRQGYHNIQEVVGTKGTQELEMTSLGQLGGGELSLVPVYGNTSSSLNFDSSGNWMVSGEINNGQRWSGEFDSNAANRGDGDLRTVVNDATITQGLSLSLFSNNLSKVPETQPGELPLLSNQCPSMKPSIISKASGGSSLQHILGTSADCIPQISGPLGPFTGYATILKSSKFLKPAQQLLLDFCNVAGSKRIKMCESSERFSGETCSPGEVTEADRSDQAGSKSGKLAVLVPSTYGGESGAGSCSSELCLPKYHHGKAKLMYMQEEVCRRYKQYHQQMQMVVSSFESVAGLSSATPYISMALKTISRHFRSLKSAISDQLSYITKALEEDLLPSTGVTNNGGNAESASRLNYLEQTIQRQKSNGGYVGSFETQHIWRPQRGLPDRAVAILKSWLFNHFLHPYPTDADKHILAAQAGLSRNQVSNWFINARVRIWKPMVEEMHMLETRSLVDTNQSCGKNEEKSTTEGSSSRAFAHSLDSYASPISYTQVEPHIIGSSTSSRDRMNVDELNTHNCLRIDGRIKSTMDGSIGVMPYQQGGLNSRGHGTVSLTLGPSHGGENIELRQQFGGQMPKDFVG